VKLVPPKFHDQPEFIMMTTKSRLLTKVSLSVAFLAFAYTSTVSTVRAQSDVPTWMMVDPISATVKALEDRIAGLEAKVASLTSQQSTGLCVADEAGARTCISKAQLDRLLKMMQTAAIDEPAKTADRLTTSVPESVIEPAKIESTVEAAEAAEAAEAVAPAAPAAETQAAVVEEPAQVETATAAVVEEPAQLETTTAAVVGEPRQPEQAALPEDTINQDSMPTGSIPAPTQGDVLVAQPEAEITTQPTEQ
jgi:hypothetical protein